MHNQSTLGTLLSGGTRSDFPDADLAVGITGEEGGAISGPGQRHAFSLLRLGAQIVNDGLAEQVPDLDGLGGGGTQPVAVGREDESVDDISGFERVQVTMLVQIPQHDDTVLTSGSAEGAVGRDGDSVDESVVAQVIDLQLGRVGLEVPDFDNLVAASGDDLSVVVIGREADGGDPFSVTGQGSVSARRGGLSNQIALAFTAGVPDLDGLVARTGDDQAVVRREGSAQNIVSVANELANRAAIAQIPQTHGAIPRSSQSVLSILG